MSEIPGATDGQAVIGCHHVFDGETRPLRAIRDDPEGDPEDSGWQVICFGDHGDAEAELAKVVHLAHFAHDWPGMADFLYAPGEAEWRWSERAGRWERYVE